MNSQPEKQLPTSPEPVQYHPSLRKWIYLRGVLLGVLVAAWWIMFAPDATMDSQLKIALGIIAGLVATGGYLYNLRQAICPEKYCERKNPGDQKP